MKLGWKILAAMTLLSGCNQQAPQNATVNAEGAGAAEDEIVDTHANDTDMTAIDAALGDGRGMAADSDPTLAPPPPANAAAAASGPARPSAPAPAAAENATVEPVAAEE